MKVEPQQHRIAEVGGHLWHSSSHVPMLKAVLTKASCSGPCESGL